MSTSPGRAKQRKDSALSDEQLVRDCLKGKESAWSALIFRYKNLIFSIPIRYGFSEEDSADIFQAVCMDWLAELPRLREPKALAGWLIQVTRNKCFHRKREAQRHSLQEIGENDFPGSEESADSLVAEFQQDQLLREAMSDLPPRCRQLVQMLFFETPALPYLRVARDLKLAPGSIGFIRRRCLDKLRERLEKLGFE
jgi:RNA polymerase sigma factor (sigma-70 family)